jgi:CheY-like chemotaxis protein
MAKRLHRVSRDEVVSSVSTVVEARVVTVRTFGFSNVERQILGSIFRLSSAAARRLRYRLWSSDDDRAPQLYLLDGSSTTAVEHWRGAGECVADQTVVVDGAHAPPNCAVALRPLGLKVVAALDRLASLIEARAIPKAASRLEPQNSSSEARAADLPVYQDAVAVDPFAASLTGASVAGGLARATASLAGLRPTQSSPAASHIGAAVAPLPPDVMSVLATPNNVDSSLLLSRRALIVDSSPAVRASLHSRLALLGIELEFAATIGEALDGVTKQHYDLVFLDVSLSNKDMYDACKMLKKNSANYATQIFMLTDSVTTIDKIRRKMAGCDGYLSKPIDAAELRSIVELQKATRTLA